MNDAPYEPFDPNHLLLRDYLALDRNALANERTLLAYVRTALALLVVGGTLLHFFSNVFMVALGVLFMAVAVTTVVIGTFRFRTMYRLIRKISKRQPPLNNGGPSKPQA